MKRIPLEPKDIPPGSCIRNLGTIREVPWFPILRVHILGVKIEYLDYIIGWEWLSDSWEIYHPILHPNWSPCYKEVET